MKEQPENIEYVIAIIEEKIRNHEGHYIVGIDGYSCAGKTTLTEKLMEYFKKHYQIYVFHLDDHIAIRKYRYNTGCEQWHEFLNLQWNANYINESLLKPLKNNTDKVKLHYYNKDEDSTTENTRHIAPNSIIIIEGVFLQRIEWRQNLNFVFFIDCPREIRFERELVRSKYSGDLNELLPKYKERYWAAEDYYEALYNPKHICDMIINTY